MSATLLSANPIVTVAHTAPNGSAALNAEVAAFDAATGLVFVAATAGIDIVDPANGEILATIATSGIGNVNSVAAQGGVLGI